MIRRDSSAPTSIDSDLLAFLRSVDSPTIANAIENLKIRDRCEGYIGGSVRCMFPDLGVMVGHALTVTMDSQPGPVADREGHGRMWEALLRTPRPSIVVVKDLTEAPTRTAYFGEVMASVAKACGAVGVITDGGLRDIAEVRGEGVDQVRRKERKMLDYIRSPEFNLKGFRDLGGY